MEMEKKMKKSDRDLLQRQKLIRSYVNNLSVDKMDRKDPDDVLKDLDDIEQKMKDFNREATFYRHDAKFWGMNWMLCMSS